jgi:hypothetical protein
LQNTQALLIFDAKPFTPYSEDCLCENLKTWFSPQKQEAVNTNLPVYPQ